MSKKKSTNPQDACPGNCTSTISPAAPGCTPSLPPPSPFLSAPSPPSLDTLRLSVVNVLSISAFIPISDRPSVEGVSILMSLLGSLPSPTAAVPFMCPFLSLLLLLLLLLSLLPALSSPQPPEPSARPKLKSSTSKVTRYGALSFVLNEKLSCCNVVHKTVTCPKKKDKEGSKSESAIFHLASANDLQRESKQFSDW